MKKILITGNSGRVGTELTKRLVKDYEVHGLDIKAPQVMPNVHYNFDIRKLFTSDIEFDCVIHLAALVNKEESNQIPIQYYITNLNGTMNLVNRVKTKKFVFASSVEAQTCDSTYGISKRAAEDVVHEYFTTHVNLPHVVVRFGDESVDEICERILSNI